MDNRFGAASPDEGIVFGASRPGRSLGREALVGQPDVAAWVAVMQEQGIQRVVCLLGDDQLALYTPTPDGLLAEYKTAFGEENVLPAPVEDFHLIDSERLRGVIDFLKDSDAAGRKVVVHCSGGSGRTGHVLAAWMAQGRGLDAQTALSLVDRDEKRNPYEAVRCSNATEEELLALIEGASGES